MLIIRDVTEERAAAPLLWLTKQPVVAVEDLLLLDSDGGSLPITPADWAVLRGGGGSAAVQLRIGDRNNRVRLRYRAGLAETSNAVPEALRQGLLRLVQHWHFAGPDDGQVPAIVTALWTPWRRTSLGAWP